MVVEDGALTEKGHYWRRYSLCKHSFFRFCLTAKENLWQWRGMQVLCDRWTSPLTVDISSQPLTTRLRRYADFSRSIQRRVIDHLLVANCLGVTVGLRNLRDRFTERSMTNSFFCVYSLINLHCWFAILWRLSKWWRSREIVLQYGTEINHLC